ncbi:hypothetical protein BT96DRAFT_984592 [Gymnopus androsaceus JB14]|uniref:Uncharacterized protein n=1 Tax=Gymnopus androsaceus JB14 TaxID=1447944 RepID=A0A6A4IFT1_9AGAR|nr:hypothetical protein BT96DRAFT_984592 [Gymnopus androsaceus JB14]
MLVSPSSPPPRGPPRISQVLPTVKCSNCNQPVPLNELGEHICSVAPPVPRLPPAARPPPTNPIPAPPSSTSLKPRASPPKAISISPRRPFANSGARGSNSSFQSRSSPLARSFPEESNEDYFARQASASSRDTMNSISSSSTARPSFISSGSGSSDAHGPTKSPSSPSAKSPVSPSPLAAQSNQNQRPPISSRIPEPPMSPISPLAALSNALASSSSAPALNGNGPPPSRPSFSTSQSMQDNRNMSNVPMSPRIPPTNV